VGISLSFLNQLTPYSIILKRNKIILYHIQKDHEYIVAQAAYNQKLTTPNLRNNG